MQVPYRFRGLILWYKFCAVDCLALGSSSRAGSIDGDDEPDLKAFRQCALEGLAIQSPRASFVPISVAADGLLGMAALSVEVESITSLRRGDQLDQIGAPMPNGLIGQRSAGQ
ncbi:hypothetical protein SAMN05444161_8425 [Rhizobiales bacterium GAS191]|nr:hypothetical protein SAMN05444161_8425 [Rhizobiales bacterium GAS191]